MNGPSYNENNLNSTGVNFMKTSAEINELAKAMSVAQGEFEGAKKDSINPHFKSKYADLASAWEACRDVLPKHGLAIIQGVEAREGLVITTTLLTHSSGQWIQSELTLMPRDQSPQSYGSVITYGRRYGMMAMLGLSAEDDDANAASMVRSSYEQQRPGSQTHLSGTVRTQSGNSTTHQKPGAPTVASRNGNGVQHLNNAPVQKAGPIIPTRTIYPKQDEPKPSPISEQEHIDDCPF